MVVFCGQFNMAFLRASRTNFLAITFLHVTKFFTLVVFDLDWLVIVHVLVIFPLPLGLLPVYVVIANKYNRSDWFS